MGEKIMMKKILAMLTTLTLTMALFAGCSGGSSGSEGEEGKNPLITDKDSLVISLSSELQTLDIFAQSNVVTNEVLTNIYEPILTFDQDGNIVGNVVESWEWNDEECKYTLHVKKGVKFHDGTEVKASDIAFTFDLISDEYYSYQSATADMMKEWKVIDDYTLDVYLNYPAAAFLNQLCVYISVYSEAAYKEFGGFTEKVVSCGPYKLVSYDSATGAVLEAFEDYHGNPKPSIKNVTFKITPDANTQVIALEKGELNISRDFPASSIASIKENENLDLYSHACGMSYYVMFNLGENGQEEFKNELVRKAVNYAIDAESILTVADEGIGELANSAANKNMDGWSEDIPSYEYDVEKAKDLMKEAGYEDGFAVDTLYCREGKTAKIAEIVQENLAAIGITTKITILENSAFIENLRAGNFNMAATYINLGLDGNDMSLITATDAAVNFAKISDEWLDEQFELQSKDMNAESRTETLNGAFKHISEKAYFATIYYPKKSYAITNGLEITGYDKFVGLQCKYIKWAE